MYNNFFGFKEKPFKLVPNPAYLFLSKSHEEAMAHLTYAVSQGDGFVELIGEVGTGKTTLCRAFLDNLDESVEAAYIFNPKLDALQLLKTINDEFGLDSRPDTIKELIDLLNAFLMIQKSAGKKVLLLIDEAQNLSKDVLEQLRLLSNLETTRDKLLQIILVGQPELAKILDSQELRQLGQRITLSCRLTPLSLPETREYIMHRITIAARRPGLRFDQAALKAIHGYSKGVPRLINIAADRALLTAYGLNRHSINEKTVKKALQELTGRHKGFPAMEPRGLGLALAGLLLFVIGSFLFLTSRPDHPPSPVPDQHPQPQTARTITPPSLLAQEKPGNAVTSFPGSGEPPMPKGSPVPDQPTMIDPPPGQTADPAEGPLPEIVPPVMVEVPTGDLAKLLATLDQRSSRHQALKTAIQPWTDAPTIRAELDTLPDDLSFFRLAVKQNNLQIRRINNDLSMIRLLNLPAVLELHLPDDQRPKYLTISRITEERITLRAGAVRLETTPAELARYWPGIAYVPWNNFLKINGTVPRNAPEESILTLKMLLRDLGFREIAMTARYDDDTKEIIKDLQRQNGLRNDGKVGPLTKIILYRQLDNYAMPRISHSAKASNREDRS